MIRRAVSLALGIAITAAAVFYLMTPEVLRDMRVVTTTANWPALALATTLAAFVQWLRAWRFSIMTNGTFALPGRPLVRIAFKLNFLNFTLPFRLGELGYPVMMRRAYGQPVARALGVLLLARLYDLFTVGAIFLAMAAALGLAGPAAGSLLLGIGAAALALAPIALVFSAGTLRPLVGYFPAGGRVSANLELALTALSARRAQFSAIALSFGVWLVFGALAALSAAAVTNDVTPAVAMLGAAASNVAFALPVNGIGGLGAAQAAFALAVIWAGVAWSAAVISAFALYAVTLVCALVFGGLAFLAGERASAA